MAKFIEHPARAVNRTKDPVFAGFSSSFALDRC
jgi:hypothetical protein